MDVKDFLASHDYSAATKRRYETILARFTLEVEKPKSVRTYELLQWIEKEEWGNATQRVALACLRKYLSWSYGAAHPALGAKIKRIEAPMPRALTREQTDILLASFNPHEAKGARDLAIAATMINTAFRASEICRLRQADTDTEKRLAQCLVKGGAIRWAIFTKETAAHIEHWKKFRERLNPKGYLFVSTKTGEGLTPEGLNSIMREWSKKVGFKISPHDFRRGFAVQGTQNGAPHKALMEGGGWKDEKMLGVYTRQLTIEVMRPWLPITTVKDRV